MLSPSLWASEVPRLPRQHAADGPSGDGGSDNEIKKKVPVCDCGEERESCPTCNRGYLQVVKVGETPKFKEITVASKRVPVCKCGHERAECADCGRGYLTVTMMGEVPQFKVVEAQGTTANQTVPPDDTTTKGLKCVKLPIFYLGGSLIIMDNVEYLMNFYDSYLIDLH